MVPVLRLALRTALALPEGLTRLRTGPPPTNDRGVAMDADLWRMVWLEGRVFGGITKTDVERARRGMERSVAIVASRPTEHVHVRDVVLPSGVGATCYRTDRPPRAWHVYFHGGGWVQGSTLTHDAFCRRLAIEADRLVMSVDYRLAPEHPYPAAVEDAVEAVRYAYAESPVPRVEVGGDSAGGNLAAAACIALRDAGERVPDLQVLIYPGLDQTRALPSHKTLGEGFLLTAKDIDWFQLHYKPVFHEPIASPLLVDSVAGLPPAIVTTAGFDPLRDEGEAYAVRLRDAGIPVVHLDEADLVHGYAAMDGMIPAANRAVTRLLAGISFADR